MLRDTVTNFLLLDPEEIARQITLNSFEVFKKIRPVEYVTDLFGLKSGFGQDNIEVSVTYHSFWGYHAYLMTQFLKIEYL